MVVAKGVPSLSLPFFYWSSGRSSVLLPHDCRCSLSPSWFWSLESHRPVSFLSRRRLSADVLRRQVAALGKSRVFHLTDFGWIAFLLEASRFSLCRGSVGDLVYFTYQLSGRVVAEILLLLSTARDHGRRRSNGDDVRPHPGSCSTCGKFGRGTVRRTCHRLGTVASAFRAKQRIRFEGIPAF